MKRFLKSMMVLAMFTQLSASNHGGDSESKIIIAPPPLVYAPSKEVGGHNSVQLNYMSFETDGYSVTGAGAGWSYNNRTEDDTFHNFSVSVNSLEGDSSDSQRTTYIDIVNVAYQYGGNITPEIQVYAGVGVNVTYMESSVPNGSLGYDTYIDIVKETFTAGVQYEYSTSFGVIVPWVVFIHVIGGTVEVDAGGYTTEADVEPFSAHQLGFDIYFESIGTSLSSMVSSTSDGDLVSLSMSHNF